MTHIKNGLRSQKFVGTKTAALNCELKNFLITTQTIAIWQVTAIK